MTIGELMGMCIEPSLCTVEIYSCDEEKVVWSGDANEVYWSEYGDYNVESFDVPTDGRITFNI